MSVELVIRSIVCPIPFPYKLNMLSLPRKMLCAPIYREPDEMREALLNKMKLLQSLQPVPWISPSTIFLKRDGLFLLKANNEGSLKVRIQNKLVSMVSFFRSSIDASERQHRLHYARRRLLISILAHAWLWGRSNVLDSQGNPIAFQDRTVLAPEDILQFLRDTRSHREGCPCEDLEGFLKTVREVPLPEDTSKWNAMGVTACLWWDKLHDSREDIWCSCRATGGSLPPYQEVYLPSYNQACSEETKTEKAMVEQESE